MKNEGNVNMEINDSGYSVINMDCFCKGKHCEGNLYVQPDTIDKQRVFMITVVDTDGSEQSNLWLSSEQVLSLIEELKFLYEKYPQLNNGYSK
jgi:hypothetical protein